MNLQQSVLSENRSLGAHDHINIHEQEPIDVDNEGQQYSKEFRLKVLFACQSLGSISPIIKNKQRYETYIKNPDCQQNVKDLIKFIRKDPSSYPRTRLILSNMMDFNIIETDLAQLLMLHVDDKKLSFFVLYLMRLLTNPPPEDTDPETKETLNKKMLEYKLAIIKSEVLTTLMIHIADVFKLAPQSRFLAHHQMVESAFSLIRNVLKIKDEESDESTHFRLILAMLKEEILNPVFYVIQLKDQKDMEIQKRVMMILFEICYHTFTTFDPASIYLLEVQKHRPSLTELAAASKARKITDSSRHSRFMPHFSGKNSHGHHLFHTITKKDEPLQAQTKKPRRVFDILKIQKIGHQYLPENYMEMNHQIEGTPSKIRKIASDLCQEFITIQFENLCKKVFVHLNDKQVEVKTETIMEYLLLCRWAIDMTITKYHRELDNAGSVANRARVEFDLGQIICVMHYDHFAYYYAVMLTEITKKQKRRFSHELFHCSISVFHCYLKAITDMTASSAIRDRNNAAILMGFMFKYQIAKILKGAFEFVIEQNMIKKLILVTADFFTLLELFSQGKALTITTNRQVKTRAKKAVKAQTIGTTHEQEVTQIPVGTQEQQNEVPSQQAEPRKIVRVNTATIENKIIEQEAPRAQYYEKRVNMISQFAQLANPDIIQKYMFFLSKDNFDSLEQDIKLGIFKYLQLLVFLLKGEWLLFQASTLVIFEELLRNKKVKIQHRLIIRHVCRCFIQLLRVNQLALVESLFRISNINTRDQILRNYNKNQQPVRFQQLQIQRLPQNSLSLIHPSTQSKHMEHLIPE